MAELVHGDSVIYLDNNATTRVAPEVVEVMLPLFSDLYGNASSMHTFGGQMIHLVNDARASVARLLGAQPEEIVFTSCGTESDSTAIFQLWKRSRKNAISLPRAWNILRLSRWAICWKNAVMK